jgi:hypothetical protein
MVIKEPGVGAVGGVEEESEEGGEAAGPNEPSTRERSSSVTMRCAGMSFWLYTRSAEGLVSR